MAGGIALLGAEGGAEGVYITESHAEGFNVQLAADGEAGLLSEGPRNRKIWFCTAVVIRPLK